MEQVLTTSDVAVGQIIKVGESRKHAVWVPQPGPQEDFLASPANYVGYGGSFGGGKSEALMAAPLRYSHYDDYKALLLRRTYKQVSDLLERCKRLYEGKLNWKWEGSNMRFRMPAGGFLEVGHVQHPGDEENYLSKEYNTIIFDQAEQFTEKMLRKICSRCRTTNPAIPPQVLMSFNPGGPGHMYVKNNFVDRCPIENRGEKRYNEKFKLWWQPKKFGGTFRDRWSLTWEFHPAIVFDNPLLVENDPIYVARLMSLPEDEREAYLWGNFEMFAGQFFKEWRHEIHVVKMAKIPKVPYTWEVTGGNDYASSGWWYAGAAAVNHHGEVIIVDEDYFRGGTLRKKATRMDMLIRKYRQMKKWAAPWDMFNEIRDRETERVTGRIVDGIKEYMEEDIQIVKAPKDRLGGWELIKDGLTWSDGEKPWLYVRENCEQLIETIPTLIYDDDDNRDLDKHGWTHGIDFVRYVLGIIKRTEKKIPIDAYDVPPKQTKKTRRHWLLN